MGEWFMRYNQNIAPYEPNECHLCDGEFFSRYGDFYIAGVRLHLSYNNILNTSELILGGRSN